MRLMWGFLVADERGSKVDKGCEQVPVAFVAYGRASVSGAPGEGAFDIPPVAAQAGGVVDAAAGNMGTTRRRRSRCRSCPLPSAR